MSWRARIRPASFRGVPFFVDSVQGDHGRRLAQHDYIKRELPWHEDLGRRAREFQVDGYLLGEDWMDQRDALEAACETRGAGLLVHPTKGEMEVVCKGLRTNENRRDGRMCQFSATFAEAGKVTYPSAARDPIGAVDQAAAGVETAAGVGLEALDVQGLPAFVREGAVSEWSKIQALLDVLDLRGPPELVAALRDQAAEIADDLLELLDEPSPLATRVLDLVHSLDQAAGSRELALKAYLGLARSRSTARGGTGPLARTAQANADLLVRTTRMDAIAGAAAAAAARDYDTLDDAHAARADVLEELDALELEADDQGLVELARLRSELVNAVPPEGANLPRIAQYEPQAVESSITAAYQLYEDPLREGEIVQRNRPRHPGFLPAGTALEVLSA
jgi:prophage DNA circulation protein